ncbi:uncharacterized protein RHOBADRAFT_55879 [Rhodotorula graminis WP1]|uniref:F-box domain-containing protein n=1 Tax=Rhodotorula graminis (strain WP1) TaxID=578459 RepID=A0A0P9EGE1_RHOGW|nr:uncharacterized protein RHOBADRAFT_55879 [Rhodotorula graminis WP1]KPV72412.1 hypothetical protein RHOBADRAFT_55879 [Rhodotorula graminis WP1]
MATAAVCTPREHPHTRLLEPGWHLPTLNPHPTPCPSRCSPRPPCRGGLSTNKRRKLGAAAHFRLFEQLPVELVERIVGHLDVEELWRLRRVNHAFYALLQDPRLYGDVSIPHLQHLDPHLVAFLPSVLSGTRHFSLRSCPSSTLSTLLPACSSHLTTLDLSFSGVRDLDLVALAGLPVLDGPGSTASRRQGGALQNLRALRVKGCRRLSAFLGQLCPTDGGAETAFPSLETIDLSWSSLSLLPLPLSTHFPRLVEFNLSTTPYLALPHLADALADVPPQLALLDLSHLGLCARDLRGLGSAAGDAHLAAGDAVLVGASTRSPARSSPAMAGDARPPPSLSSPARPALHLVLSGNDALTHQSLAALRHHWAAPHSQWAGRRPVEVEHSPVLLESDDEDDVRRFVEMVAGVVMRGEGEEEGRRSRGERGPEDEEARARSALSSR